MASPTSTGARQFAQNYFFANPAQARGWDWDHKSGNAPLAYRKLSDTQFLWRNTTSLAAACTFLLRNWSAFGNIADEDTQLI